MSTVPPDFSIPFINGVHQVASDRLGRGLVDAFRSCFTTGGKVRDGDCLVRRSRALIRQYYGLLPIQDQDNIVAAIES